MVFTLMKKASFSVHTSFPLRLMVKVTSLRLIIFAVYGQNEHFPCPGVCPKQATFL